jgi:hypothetical protein
MLQWLTMLFSIFDRLIDLRGFISCVISLSAFYSCFITLRLDEMLKRDLKFLDSTMGLLFT